ncbi:MAG: MFS transporter [Anaerolineae bacterium]|nr:MFS transporter [Anaerolineae bacterium]
MATTTAPITTTQKIRALPWSLAAGALNSVFVQFTFFGSAFILFLNELDISTSQIGFLLSMFPFLGLVALFIAPMVARFGYKRTYITFFGIRKFVTILLLTLPWVSVQFGPQVTLIVASVVVIGFGLCRAISEVGYYPWAQEFIPHSIRGKYTANSHVMSSIASIIAVAVASFVLSLPGGLERFQFLIVIGILFGFASVWSHTHVPGGDPISETDDEKPATYRDMLRTLRDKNLIFYLVGIALITFGTGPLYSFLPLFMKEQVGLTESQVVLLPTAALVGGLLMSNLLGWSADRYGSKPIMLLGVILMIALPFGWLFMPKGSEISLPVALSIAFFQGISGTAWMLGSRRLLFGSVVPDNERSRYMAVYYSAIGIVGGLSQLIGGNLIDWFSGLSGQVFFVELNPFSPLMLASVVLPTLSLLIFQRVRGDSNVSVTEYAGMFIQGNPINALESLVRFYRARDERATVVQTEKMGLSHSPLTVDELVDALTDPRFNVRYEAVISIARTPSHPRLTSALIEILLGTELSLSNVAAWALGRIGDPEAVAALREGLNSDYRSVRAHCARALGTLKDQAVRGLLLEHLKNEEDKGLQMAYAAALGNLGAEEAIETVFALLLDFENDRARMELALSLARMIGQENQFINLMRQLRADPGTAAAQSLLDFRQHVGKEGDPEFLKLITRASDAFAAEDLDAGVANLVLMIQEPLAKLGLRLVAQKMLNQCAQALAEHGAERSELLLLTLHVLQAGAIT